MNNAKDHKPIILYILLYFYYNKTYSSELQL